MQADLALDPAVSGLRSLRRDMGLPVDTADLPWEVAATVVTYGLELRGASAEIAEAIRACPSCSCIYALWIGGNMDCVCGSQTVTGREVQEPAVRQPMALALL